MKTAEPKIIYLQIGEDVDIKDMKAHDFETNAITWCWDKIHDNDIKFISANEIISKIDEMIRINDLETFYGSEYNVDWRIGKTTALTELKQWMEEK